jgi:hypothetical protein
MKLQAKAIVSSKENPQTICFFKKKKKKNGQPIDQPQKEPITLT